MSTWKKQEPIMSLTRSKTVGKVAELTITVTVREKETGEEAASDAAINALNNMVDKAIALGSEDAALNEAIANAQAVLAKETPTAVEVVTALLDLSEAMANLNTGGYQR